MESKHDAGKKMPSGLPGDNREVEPAMQTTNDEPRKVDVRPPFFWYASALLVWIYAIVKLLIYDFDSLYIAQYFPAALPLYNFKFLFICIVFAGVSFFMRKGRIIVYIIFLIFFPFYVFFFQICPFVFRRGSWTLVFAFLSLCLSYFRSFRYKLIITAAFVTSVVTVATSSSLYLVYISGAMAVVCIYIMYIRSFIVSFRGDPVIGMYRNLSSFSSRQIIGGKTIDAEIKGMRREVMDEEQLKKWTNEVGFTVLANRSCLFLARKLNLYKKSGVAYISGVLWSTFLIFITIFTFWLVNEGLYRISPNSYAVTTVPSPFLFLYYSFKAFIFNSISEITPVSVVSQGLSMAENLLALLIIAVFTAIVVSFRGQRHASELDDVIEDIKSNGKEIEIYIKDQYSFQTVEDAMDELNRLEHSIVKILIWMSASIK